MATDTIYQAIMSPETGYYSVSTPVEWLEWEINNPQKYINNILKFYSFLGRSRQNTVCIITNFDTCFFY